MSKTVTALVPMKGHSERVPRKNLRLFAGRPLYHRILESLGQCAEVDKIAVDTDCPEITRDVQEHFPRVQILERPEAIRGDLVPMNDIIAHDLSVLEGEHFLQTHSTNPLLRPETIKRAIEKYFEDSTIHDSLFSVTRMQTRLYWQDGKPVNHNPGELLRTQDLPPVFEENSNLYLFSRESFRDSGNRRIGSRPQLFAIERTEAMDIDEEEDFHLAEILYHEQEGRPCP